MAAAQRGVDVRILLPGFSDSKLVLNASRAIYGPLLRGGVHIFEFDAAFVHAKTAVVDAGVALVGSANMDYRSLVDNNEITALIVDAATNGNLAARFQEDQARATAVTFARWNRRSWLQRAREGTAILLWRWL